MTTEIINNRYVLESVIGQGAMGVVHRAYDRLSREYVAVKRIRVAVDQLDLGTMKPTTRDRSSRLLALTREFRLLASMRHPHIISVLDYGVDADQSPYFVMDYLENARNIQQASADRPLDGKIDLLIQMLQALAYLHRRGILHRDLKLDNVLVDAADKLKVLDFGLSVDRENARGRAGTLAYMAPETLQQGISVEESDLYSVGVIAYEILGNQLPFSPDDIISILSEEPDMSPLDAPQAVTDVIARLLHKQPQDRYRSAHAVIAAFEDAIGRDVHHEETAIRDSYLQAAAFVGREDELRTLRNALTDAMSGTGSFWLIGGESGIGKSRLLAELRTYALVEGTLVLTGEASPGAGLSYQLWRKVVPQLALITDLTPQEASILQDVAPDIHQLTGHDPVPVPEAGGNAAQQRLIATLITILRRIQQPVILLLEDLHWMNESLVILQQIAPLIHEQPLCIIGTYRIEERVDLPEQLPQAQVMRLATLSEAEMTQLGETMLGADEQQNPLLDLLQQETGGNPLFVVEMLRALAEDAGTLSNIARQTLPLGVFMQGIRRVIEERLKRIPARLRPVLNLASVLGREINTHLLSIHFDDTLIQDWLMSATDNAILEVADNRWFFSHEEIRDTVLGTLSDEQRQTIHRQAAQAYEQTHGDDPAYAALLVEHWQEAGDRDKTFHYARVAAQFAFARGLLEPAQTFAERALNYADVELDAFKVIALRLLLAEIHVRIGDYDSALDIYRTVVVEAIKRNDPANQAKAMSQIGWIHLRRSNITLAWDHCVPALRLARESEDKAVLGLALKNLGFIALNSGEFDDASSYFTRSLEHAREMDTTTEIAALLNALGLVYLIQGLNHEAYRYFTESLTYFERLDDRWNMAVALHNQGAVLTNMGDYAGAEVSFKRSLALDESINDHVGVIYHLTYLAHIAVNHEDYMQALDHIDYANRLLKNIADRKLAASLERAAGWVQLYRRDFDAAEYHLQRALDINTELGHQPTIIVSQIGLAWLDLLRDEWESAYATFTEHIENLRESGDRWTTAETLNGMALVLHHQGDDDTARKHLRESVTLMRPLAATPILLEAFAVYARTCADSAPQDAAAWCYLIINDTRARTLARQLSRATLETLNLSASDRTAAENRARTLDLDTCLDQLLGEL